MTMRRVASDGKNWEILANEGVRDCRAFLVFHGKSGRYYGFKTRREADAVVFVLQEELKRRRRNGGLARKKALSPERRKAIARKAALARWGSR